MTEQRMTNKPKKLFDQALRVVKGDQSQQLIEEFTSEMTLVAEGLCEDQARLRESIKQLEKDTDRIRQRIDTDMEAAETSLLESQREMDRKIDALSKKITALENTTSMYAKKQRYSMNTILKQVTLIVGILCGAWVLTSIIGLIR